MLALQRQAGNAAVAHLVQRLAVQRDDDDWAGHPDPNVGQSKPYDPNDKTWGLSGTWDFGLGDKGKPKVTGAYGDVPGVGGVDPKGGQAKYPQDKDQGDSDAGSGAPGGGGGGGRARPARAAIR